MDVDEDLIYFNLSLATFETSSVKIKVQCQNGTIRYKKYGPKCLQLNILLNVVAFFATHIFLLKLLVVYK